MIRIVGYLVPDASMPNERRPRWFTIWEAPPNLSSSAALKRAAARMVTWEQRLKVGSFNGVSRVALEAVGDDATEGSAVGHCCVRVLEHSRP